MRHKDRPENIYHGPLNKNDKTIIKIKLQEICGQYSPYALWFFLANKKKWIGQDLLLQQN